MANQIGDFFAVLPEAEASRGVATHLQKFWTPKMIGELIAQSDASEIRLNPTAARAVEALRQEIPGKARPPSVA